MALWPAEAWRICASWRGDHYPSIDAVVMDDTGAIGAVVEQRIGAPYPPYLPYPLAL